MTNQNYTLLSNYELFKLIISFGKKNKFLEKFLRYHQQDVFTELINRTCFLDLDYKTIHVPITARLYCLEHDILKTPICSNPLCSNPVKFEKTKKRFRIYCCEQCCASDESHKQKVKMTMIKRHGCEHPMHCQKIKDKLRQTKKDRYGDENYNNRAKAKQTTFNHYGVEVPFKNECVKQKARNTCKLKYRVEFPITLQQFKDKSKQTCIEKYGVNTFTQTSEFAKFHRKRILHDGIWFDSNWEVIVYDYCRGKGFDFEYQPNISYQYECCGKTFVYHPDFIVNGKVYEIKGDQFFRTNTETGQEEMYCPWRKETWDDDKYAFECFKAECKHQCIKTNGVIILRKNEIKHMDKVFI